MIIMDKMKEHSCAIQPAFGYGGGGFNGLNFAMMFDQVFNTDNLLAPDDEPDDLLDQPIFLSQIDGIITAVNQQQQPLTGPAATAFQQSIQATEQALQGINYPILQQHQHDLTVAELVANAVHQHIATHHATQAQFNNGTQPEMSVSEMISNAIHEQLTAPAGSFGLLTAPLHLAPLVPNFIAVPIAASNQSQANTMGLSTNAFQNIVATTESQQQVAPEMSSYDQYMGHIYQQIASHSSASSSFSGTTVPDIVLSGVHNNVSPAPPDEESNSSIPPFHAPVSSPAHLYFSNNFNPSDEEDYIPTLVESNIIVIDSAGNSNTVDEN